MLVKCDITVTVAPATKVSFKNRVPFPKCITKMLVTTTDDAEDLNIVMSMYNLIEYGSDYSEAAGSLWFYVKDEATNFNNDIENTDKFESFKYKAKLLENTVAQPAANNANGILKNATIVVPLKY